MEKPPSGRSPKQHNKAKKKQIKVVYITNPMRVKTTAAEFKGLVQELTGQDSDIAERLSKFNGEMEQAEGVTASAGRGSVSSDGSLVASTSTVACPPNFGNGEIHEQQQQQQQRLPSEGKGMSTPYDMFDDDFPAQILEDFECFMPSSSTYYESSPAIGDDSNNLGTA